jgi:serine/threonine protein kinase
LFTLFISLGSLFCKYEELAIDAKIGEGAFADVFRGRNKSNEIVAIKRLKGSSDHPLTVTSFSRELNGLLRVSSNSNFIKLLGCTKNPFSIITGLYHFPKALDLQFRIHGSRSIISHPPS